MDEHWQIRVRERAYVIWDREGRPEGEAERHWLLAEQELRGERTEDAARRSPEAPGEEKGSENLDLTVMGSILP